MRVAVLSDTHGLLRPQVQEFLGTCDAVIHGGDIISQKLLDQIQECSKEGAPLYVVRGNNDREWATHLPASLFFELEGVKFFLVHNKKDVPKDLGDVQIVIYGHTHKFAKETKGNQLWLNPGSCGKRRFRLPVTMVLLHLEHGAWSVERIDFEQDEKKVNKLEALSEAKMVDLVTEIFVRMDKGQTIEYVAFKVGLEATFVEEIFRIRVTHPGVTPNGVVDKMEVNRVVVKSSKE